MKEERNRFLCIGNGGYYNRGCEAIVRGTMTILRRTFGQSVEADIGFYGGSDEIQQQAGYENDASIRTFRQVARPARWSMDWFATQCNQRLGTHLAGRHRSFSDRLSSARATLILGGDTYSLDYGRPTRYIEDDNFAMRNGVPLVLWCASVGPFTKDPDFEPIMRDHLRRLSAVLVRETITQEYLSSIGVTENVHLVADPAFLMEPVEVPPERLGFNMPEGAIGLNFSPLIARYVADCGGDAWRIPAAAMEQWVEICAQLVARIHQSKARPIVLIPHVMHKESSIDDAAFLAAVARKAGVADSTGVYLVPQALNAQELKWVIGKCHVFAGARTHSTIAGLSSLVPTLTIGFSVKAVGINTDIFGHTDFVEDSEQFDVESFLEKLSHLLKHRDTVHEALCARIPAIKDKAFFAGTCLENIIANTSLPR